LLDYFDALGEFVHVILAGSSIMKKNMEKFKQRNEEKLYFQPWLAAARAMARNCETLLTKHYHMHSRKEARNLDLFEAPLDTI
jgi:hypothetical protein